MLGGRGPSGGLVKADSACEKNRRMSSAARSGRPDRAFLRGRLGRGLLALIALSFLLFGVWPANADEPAASGSAQNLLAGKKPIRANVHRRLDALTDGRRGREGDPWKSQLMTPFDGRESEVVYDLGADVPIVAAWLQGDNNDTYELEISSDGNKFSPLWSVPAQRNGGLRIRSTTSLEGHGRYLKLHPRSGDGFFGVTELQAFSQVPPEMPPPGGREVRGGSVDGHMRDATTLLGLALLAPLLLVHRRSKPGWIATALGLAALGLWYFGRAYLNVLPIETREVSLVRGVLGAVAAFAVAREVFAPRRYPAHRPIIIGTLALTGVLGVLAFYNLGQPQFYSRGHDEWTFSHYLDLRQYYTTSKYFDELGYRGIYEADVASYLEDNPGRAQQIQNIPMRDLHSLKMSTPAAQAERIAAIKKNFTPERWEQLKEDNRWFRSAMGDAHWLEMLCDYGGNATPVWIAIAHFLFKAVAPSNLGFTLLGMLDLALLTGMFFAIWRCYGLRTMLVTMTVFGANDFIMYGTNWGGATLRHDWLAYIGFAACALRREKYALGGALLALSTMIRVFPALALVGVALPAILRVGEQVAKERRLPKLKELMERERATLHVVLGAAAAVVVSFGLSAAVLSPASWPECLHKVSQLSADPHPASIALRSLIGGSEGNQASVINARQPLFIFAIAFYVGGVVMAARRRRLDQCALLGMILVPVLLYPANYYIHFVFLLPLLATERPAEGVAGATLSRLDAGIWLLLLLMCAVQYFTVPIPDLGLHFALETVVLFCMLTILLGLLVYEDAAAWFAVEPAAES